MCVDSCINKKKELLYKTQIKLVEIFLLNNWFPWRRETRIWIQIKFGASKSFKLGNIQMRVVEGSGCYTREAIC